MSALWNDLKDRFTDNAESEAVNLMHGEGVWGYKPYNTQGYIPSTFEIWATAKGIKEPVMVDNYGGEDMGSTYYAVWKFERDGEDPVFIKFEGWYASYNGADYNGFDRVFPKEVTKVVYE